MQRVHYLHFFPIKGMQGFNMEKCLLRENKLLANDRKFALTQTSKVNELTSWQPKSHFKQLVNQPTLAKIKLQLVTAEPLVIKINNQDKKFDLTNVNSRNTFAKTIEKLSSPKNKLNLSLVKSITGGLSDTRDQWVSVGGTASANQLIETFGLDHSLFRFRLNIWIQTKLPFEEFNWIGRKAKIGSALLEFISPVGRCNAINVSAETGESTNKSIPQQMRASFGHSNLGIFARIFKTGSVNIHDRLELL